MFLLFGRRLTPGCQDLLEATTAAYSANADLLGNHLDALEQHKKSFVRVSKNFSETLKRYFKDGRCARGARGTACSPVLPPVLTIFPPRMQQGPGAYQRAPPHQPDQPCLAHRAVGAGVTLRGCAAAAVLLPSLLLPLVVVILFSTASSGCRTTIPFIPSTAPRYRRIGTRKHGPPPRPPRLRPPANAGGRGAPRQTHGAARARRAHEPAHRRAGDGGR